MGDGGTGTINSGGTGHTSITYTFAPGSTGIYTVTVSMTGLDGTFPDRTFDVILP